MSDNGANNIAIKTITKQKMLLKCTESVKYYESFLCAHLIMDI